MRAHAHLNSARSALAGYGGTVPFAQYLKAWFRERPQMGASDRRAVSALCHGWLRLGAAAPGPPDEAAVLAGAYLTAGLLPDVAALRPEWADAPPSPSDLGIDAGRIFPLPEALSAEIPAAPFSASHLRQPDLFIRLRPGREGAVAEALAAGGIPYGEAAPGVLRLPPATRLEHLARPEWEYVVQDLSSAETLSLLREAELGERFSAWDCCAASGGKSILLRDEHPHCGLTVTDIRKSILHNLSRRFAQAGIRNYRSFVADLAEPGGVPEDFGPFDLILCDAPCTGSGTWGRTPEWLRAFHPSRIAHYAGLQQRILAQAATRLRPGGYLLYITCSVFRAENEDTVAWAESALGLRLLAKRYHAGWARGSDTLFSALMTGR